MLGGPTGLYLGRLVKAKASSPKKDVPASDREGNEAGYQKEHDKLAADLVIMARNLKRNNLAFQEKLKQDREVSAAHGAYLMMHIYRS